MQESCRRNVDAACWLIGDEKFRIGCQFTCGNQFLRIAAGKRVEPLRNRACPHRIALDHILHAGLDRVPAQERASIRFGIAVGSGDCIFRQRQARCAALRKAVGGKIGKTLFTPARRIGAQHIRVVEADGAGRSFCQTGQNGNKAALAAAVHTCNTDDFACANGEVDIVDAVGRIRRFGRHAVHGEDRSGRAGLVGAFWNVDRMAHDHLHDGVVRHIGKLFRAGNGTGAQHGDAFRQLAHFVQLVRNEKNGDAVVAQAFQPSHQFLNLRRRENGSRFVEDQQSGAARQRLQNFDLLLRSHG